MSNVETVSAIFERYAQGYDGLRRQLIPCFDMFYGAVLDLVEAMPPQPTLRVLDLGAGTGLLSAMIVGRFPDAELHLIDAAQGMLDQARTRFSERTSVSFSATDMTSADLGGPYEIVASALAIHHLSDAEKKLLFAQIRSSLAPGGIFVNAEQVLGASPAVDQRQNAQWLAQIRASGLPEAEIDNALERMSVDKCAPVEDQLAWMREAGFRDVDCSFRSGRFAVLSGVA